MASLLMQLYQSEFSTIFLSLAAGVIVSIGSNLIVNVKDQAWQPQTR